MKSRSAKQKGKRLQNEVVTILKNFLNITDDDIRPVASSVLGEDIIFSERVRKIFPYSIEVKNQEKLNIWKAIEQAKRNTPDKLNWLVVFSRNRDDIYVVLDFKSLLMLLEKPENG